MFLNNDECNDAGNLLQKFVDIPLSIYILKLYLLTMNQPIVHETCFYLSCKILMQKSNLLLIKLCTLSVSTVARSPPWLWHDWRANNQLFFVSLNWKQCPLFNVQRSSHCKFAVILWCKKHKIRLYNLFFVDNDCK